MDIVTGTFLIVGSAAWLVRLFRRRDVVDWLVLPALFVMLMPSALSIAFPVENPSATRTSGSLPFAYLLAAYGMAMLVSLMQKTIQRRRTIVLPALLVVGMIGAAYGANSALYFGPYRDAYAIAAQPYSQTGRILRGFADSNGTYGNAFMVAYPYWLDHRAIGIEAGRIDWPNGLLTVDDFAQQIRNNEATPYAFDPSRAVLFFYHEFDEEAAAQLHRWFPEGNSILQLTDYEVKDFYTFVAPPPGDEWLQAFMAAHPVE
jgi:hypothetical protein